MARRNGKRGKAEVQVGDKWARLECIEIGKGEREIDSGEGVVERRPEDWFRALCDCGTVLRVWARDYPGKTRLLDCGCGLGVMDGMKVQYGIYGPGRLKIELGKVARDKGWSRNKTAVEAMRIGLEILRGRTG